MKNTKRLTAIMTTAILISLMASSLVASADTIIGYNPNQGTTSPAPAYMDASNSAKAAASKYGNLLNPEYEWWDPWGNNPERTGFNPGPAPDRPDVLFRTDSGNPIPKVILGDQVLASGVTGGVNAPFVNTMTQAVIGFSGQIFCGASIRVNATNSTTRNALVSLNPHTGAVNWASIVGFGPTTGASLSTDLYKVDDTHIAVLGGGLSMFNTDGKFLWRDASIQPEGHYRSAIVVQGPVYLLLGPHEGPRDETGEKAIRDTCWTLANPDLDMGIYKRSLWNNTRDVPGITMEAYGDGLVYMGSYSGCLAYALNATTGAKVWERYLQSYVGYTGTYADGTLFVGCASMHITALNGTTGEVLWQNDEGLANRAFNVYDIIYAYGRIYLHDLGFGRTGAQKCLDAKTGKILWAATELHQIGYYTICVGDGKIYGNQADGSTTTGRVADPTKFACWDAFTGEVLWTLKMSINTPTLAYGCLYFIAGSQLWCISTAFEPQDWSMWRGNVETPSFTLDAGPRDISGGPKWTFTTGAAIISSPVVADGKLYVNSGDRYVYCLDAYNGSLIWRFKTNEPRMTTFGSTPAVANGKVFIGPDDGNMYCLDANTGEQLWKVAMGTYDYRSQTLRNIRQHSIRSSPIIYQGNIYVGSVHDNKTYCVNMNGNVLWSVDLGRHIVGSAAIAGGYIYMMTWNVGTSGKTLIYKLNMTGGIVLSFNVTLFGVFVSSGTGWDASYTPTVVGDRLWFGATNDMFRCYNTTTGNEIYATRQPYVTGEYSDGALVYVPDWALTTRNATSGRTFPNIGGVIIGQCGPTVACARADNGSNIWSAWGGWEVWGAAVFSGIGDNALIYFGSDSYSITVLNASTGTPISWYTTGGNIASSPAIWDGKLYIGSYDNKIYCFEDHPTQEMAISMSVDKTTVDLNNTESLAVTAKLTGVPSDNPYEEIGRAAPVPPMPNASVIVTFTSPSGTDTNVTATTDKNGMATVTFTPNAKGTWKAIAWYTGADHATFSYGYAFSDQVPIEATQTITEPEKPVEPTTTNIPVEYVYAAIAVVVIVIVAAAALMLLRRRKK